MASNWCCCSRSFPEKHSKSRIVARWGSTRSPMSTRLWTSLPVKESNWCPLVLKVRVMIIVHNSCCCWFFSWNKFHEKKYAFFDNFDKGRGFLLCFTQYVKLSARIRRVEHQYINISQYNRKKIFINHKPQMFLCGYKLCATRKKW